MVYEVSKDVCLFNETIEISKKEHILVGVYSYNGGDKKVRFGRVFSGAKNGIPNTRRVPVKGLSVEELKKFIPAFKNAVCALQTTAQIVPAQPVAVAPVAPQVPIAPTVPVVPQVPNVPTVPVVPQVPKIPAVPVVPIVPTVPEMIGFI